MFTISYSGSMLFNFISTKIQFEMIHEKGVFLLSFESIYESVRIRLMGHFLFLNLLVHLQA